MAMMLTPGLGATGPLYMCPDGTTQVVSPADCPGGAPAGFYQPNTASDIAQMQAEIAALYQYTQAGQVPTGTTAGLPSGSQPAPAVAPTNWGIIALGIAGLGLMMAMARR